MQTDELVEKAVKSAMLSVIKEHPMGHWRDDQVKEVARRAIVEAALSAAKPAGEPLELPYKNWRGEISTRKIQPIRIEFGATEWHPEPQWLLVARDIEKNAERSFALRDFNPPQSTAPSVAVKATSEALEQFTAYFVKNYPGPNTIIFDPKWHAPKIFRAAVSALSAQVQDLARIELAARFVEKRRDDYVREHGSYDPSTGFTEFPGSGEEYVGELEEIIDGIRKLDPATAQVQDTPEKVGRFGHHPEPAIDFCIEVEALEGHLFDAKHGIGKPGHEPRRIDDEFRRRVSSAMDFIVGGDQIAIAAKATLRSISAQVQDVAVAEIVSKHGDPEAFGERELVALVDIQKFPYRTKLYAAAPAKHEGSNNG